MAHVKLSTSTFASSLKGFATSFPQLSSAQFHRLEDLCDRVDDWNKKVNLISRKDIDLLVPNHVIPSLSITQIKFFQKGERLIDVGTGGRFPGLPMAIACPDVHFTLLDSNAKKMKVVQDIVDGMKLENVRVITSRAENLHETFDYMMGRAVSALPNFLSFSSHLLSTSSQQKEGLFYIKGGDFTDEIKEAKLSDCTVHKIAELVAGLSTDKNVLVIPRHEVIKFHKLKPKSLL